MKQRHLFLVTMTLSCGIVLSSPIFLMNTSKFPGMIQLLPDPSDDQLLQQLSGCECAFINDKFDQPGILRIEGSCLEKLLKKNRLSIIKVQV